MLQTGDHRRGIFLQLFRYVGVVGIGVASTVLVDRGPGLIRQPRILVALFGPGLATKRALVCQDLVRVIQPELRPQFLRDRRALAAFHLWRPGLMRARIGTTVSDDSGRVMRSTNAANVRANRVQTAAKALLNWHSARSDYISVLTRTPARISISERGPRWSAMRSNSRTNCARLISGIGNCPNGL
jgi:hypothetical protein